MSYEYFASLDADVKFSLVELLQRSHLEQLAIVLSVSENEVLLRWTNFAVRSKWPEDVTIVRDAKGLYVLFHNGNKENFLLLLAKLSAAVDILLGRSIKFTEV